MRSASNGKTIDIINPVNNEVIDTLPSATQQDIEDAISFAVDGQRDWAKVSLHERGRRLRRFVSLIDEHAEEMSLLLCKEMGKPITEARGDFGSVKMLFNGFIEAANHFLGNTMPIGVQEGKEKDFEITIHEPLGVIACIIPFNAPLVLFSHKVAPSLIAGNSVIVKPSSDAPLTLMYLGNLMLEAGVPGGAIQFVTGNGSKIGDLITKDPRIAKVSFTGSTAIGVKIAEGCAQNLTKVSLELGGNAPFVVMDDADIDDAVNEAVAGRASYVTGQICNVAKRFLIHSSIKEEFKNKLIERLKKIKIGDPLDPETQMGTLISENAAIEIERQVKETIAQGAKLVYGGERNGAYYIPAVLDEVTSDMDISHNMEIFGPVFPIIPFDTLDEAIALSNDTVYGLGAGIMTKDFKQAMKFAIKVEAGSVIINGQSFYRSALMPFGGYKKSGIGREGLTITLEEVTQIKSIVFKSVL